MFHEYQYHFHTYFRFKIFTGKLLKKYKYHIALVKTRHFSNIFECLIVKNLTKPLLILLQCQQKLIMLTTSLSWINLFSFLANRYFGSLLFPKAFIRILESLSFRFFKTVPHPVSKTKNSSWNYVKFIYKNNS